MNMTEVAKQLSGTTEIPPGSLGRCPPSTSRRVVPTARFGVPLLLSTLAGRGTMDTKYNAHSLMFTVLVSFRKTIAGVGADTELPVIGFLYRNNKRLPTRSTAARRMKRVLGFEK